MSVEATAQTASPVDPSARISILHSGDRLFDTPRLNERVIPMLRMYWPNEKKPSIVDGSWTIPPVKKV